MPEKDVITGADHSADNDLLFSVGTNAPGGFDLIGFSHFDWDNGQIISEPNGQIFMPPPESTMNNM